MPLFYIIWMINWINSSVTTSIIVSEFSIHVAYFTELYTEFFFQHIIACAVLPDECHIIVGSMNSWSKVQEIIPAFR